MLVHWNNSPQINMSPPLGHIILIRSQSVPGNGNFHALRLCSFSLMLLISEETTNTNFIVFSLTRSELEPSIYRTRVAHASPLHYRCLQFIFYWWQVGNIYYSFNTHCSNGRRATCPGNIVYWSQHANIYVLLEN
jgi:hypothetical protein